MVPLTVTEVRKIVAERLAEQVVGGLPAGEPAPPLAPVAALTKADLERINLAVQLCDQQQIYVPYQEEGTPPAPVISSAPASRPVSSRTVPSTSMSA